MRDPIVAVPDLADDDTTRASIAGVYDAFLGGKDNYAVDREVLRRVRKVAPEARDLARENQAFLVRVCRFLARRPEVTQFLDCGFGLPTGEHPHQVVQRINPEATVVYVDDDPVVLAHGRALLADNDNVRFVGADIFQPKPLMESDRLRACLDFTRPIAFLQVGTLHHYEGDRDGPARIMREYLDYLPSGSFVAISHFIDPENAHSAVARRMEQAFRSSTLGSGTFRTKAEIEQLFAGLDLVPPGVTRCVDWWPDGPRSRPLNQVQHCIAGGVGRKRLV
ncbi:SAM-dependent methyltransferase [Amycolatopsis taiwanensis]|uniref:S-adenosyl methyltransferase n=1 Tax=Amycolatopsis taiwanensis TaxID=342230 RepID=A0A9W6R1F5_9PSEU|nr:SAM-dependent methyltransferase [Amycolatopsis taiwanensis]GLY67394.1 hypothetical protein Atai01_40130 [Amycolatopsis taiwanensis]